LKVDTDQECSLILLENLSTTSDETGSSGGDETDLLTSRFVTSDSGWVTDVLMVTTTVGMLNWVHGDTSHSWPVVPLSLCLVPGSVGLEEGLVGSLTSSDQADHGSAATNDGLSGAGWESDSGLLSIVGVADDDSRGAGGSGERSSITELGLTVGHDRSFWQVINWDNISNCELSLGSTVDVLA